MNVDDLMAKAAQAVESARALLARGDADGACNRAYYAMFDAARARCEPPGTMSAKRTVACSTPSTIFS
ncbi:hypothetical protein GALL_240040 [mine drainage metagenome]|uniref:HEPN domain-containing protein n=1 Tax=mine drainage metagenome TaxID=410659 RepID=A0A1J5RD27_9ZZZZ